MIIMNSYLSLGWSRATGGVNVAKKAVEELFEIALEVLNKKLDKVMLNLVILISGFNIYLAILIVNAELHVG